jgi:hypothetical protein
MYRGTAGSLRHLVRSLVPLDGADHIDARSRQALPRTTTATEELNGLHTSPLATISAATARRWSRSVGMPPRTMAA